MNAIRRALVAEALLAATLAALVACTTGQSSGSSPAQSLSTRIVGEWTSDPFESQLGLSTEVFCFREDGTFAVQHNSQAGSIGNSGTYRVEADQVTVSVPDPGSTSVLQVAWAGQRLVLTDDRKKPRTYRRTSKAC